MGKHKHKEHHKLSHHHHDTDDYLNNYSQAKRQRISDNEMPSGSSAKERPGSKASGNVGSKLPIELCNPDFPYEEYRYTLNKIFFRDKDRIQRGTKLYEEFWLFLNKYQHMQRCAKSKKVMTKGVSEPEPGHSKIFSIPTEEMSDMLMRGHLFKDDRKSKLTEERLTEFQYIINLYLNFLEKEKEMKLIKLKESQKNLPIYKYKEDILEAVSKNQVIVVAGDTGCGKSTQVPQYLLAAGYSSIACTQPRRIACISLCNRVAYETQNEYGSEIGYQIRFEKSKTSNTKILFLTEGLLLRQVASDPMLSSYSVVILDEVHERHLPCDFLLGIMKCLSVQRPDLKIVLMSATINIELFADYFDNCPVIQVPGRLFPIETKFCPITQEEQKTRTGRLNPSPYLRIMNMIDQQYPEKERGDMLIFLSGMTEISTIEEAAKQYAEKTQKWIVLPLHSTLSLEQQDKVFDVAPESVRKCIISTNIAETSVTIDGIRFVVDSGKVKEMSYDPSCHMQRLQEFWISQASAEQRKGRAGRTGPGVCFRMYSEKEYHSMTLYAKPEIQRVPLDSLILQMMSIGLPDPRKFPFLEPPCMSSIEEAVQSLKDQGALTDEEVLTPIGQMLSRLPVEVTIGKILIHGALFSLTEPVLSLAAALSVQNPFTNRTNRDPDLVAARQLLDSVHGDPFTLLNSYHKWLEVKADHRGNSKQWCRKRGLEEQRFYEMSKLRRQFKDLLKDASLLSGEDTMTSSYDRSQRHGELKHLKDMKKQYRSTPRMRKVLKVDSVLDGFADAEDKEDEGQIDIRDVEFRMSHDRKQVYELSSSSQVTSYREIVCLKLIVCSGLYPQFAVADVHNSFKSDSDQHFHTRAKPFTVMHPNSVFALQPDLLQLSECNVLEVKGFRSQTPVSDKHQLLAYMSLLETTKPFLVNCLRVSAAHALLLLCRSLDTDESFTRIICDGWLELRFTDPEAIQDFIAKAMQIRDSWQELLKKAFEDVVLDKEKKLHEIQKMGKRLLHSVVGFFMIEIPYCIKRLLAADVRDLYITPHGNPLDADSSSVHPTKGGIMTKSYLTYNCLTESEDKHLQYIQKPWVCPVCGQEMMCSVLDQVRHKEKCQQKAEETEKTEQSEEAKQHALKKSYFCKTCNEELHLSVADILRHKKSHSSS